MRLKELAAEFGFALPPVCNDFTFAPPVFPLSQGSSQPVKAVPSRQYSVPAPRGSLVEELRRRMAADTNAAATNDHCCCNASINGDIV